MNSTVWSSVDALSLRATRLLLDGAFDQAADCWRCGLHCLLPSLLAAPEGPNLDLKSIGILRPVPAISCSSSALRNVDERIFCTYSSAFVCPLSGDQTASLSPIDVRRYSVGLCYNVALAHHLCGLQGETSRTHFEKALQAYATARDLLRTLTPDASMLPDDLKIVALAIVNNEGQISEQMLQDTTNEYLEEMRAMLSYTSVSCASLQFHETAMRNASQFQLHFHAPAA
jgi:hypothetical protein